MAGSRSASRRGIGAVTGNLSLGPEAWGQTEITEMTWTFETAKLASSDMLPLTRLHLPNNPTSWGLGIQIIELMRASLI